MEEIPLEKLEIRTDIRCQAAEQVIRFGTVIVFSVITRQI